MNWIAWNFAIGRPNALRSLAYCSDCSKRALRQAEAQRGDRDAAAVEDLQELLQAGAARAEQRLGPTRQPWNDSARVSEACQPILRSGAEIS